MSVVQWQLASLSWVGHLARAWGGGKSTFLVKPRSKPPPRRRRRRWRVRNCVQIGRRRAKHLRFFYFVFARICFACFVHLELIWIVFFCLLFLMLVCVTRLKRKLLLAGGHRGPIELCPTKLSMVSLGYLAWSARRTCFWEDPWAWLSTIVRLSSLGFRVGKAVRSQFNWMRNHAIEKRHSDAYTLLFKCVACGGCPTSCHRAGPPRPSNDSHFGTLWVAVFDGNSVESGFVVKEGTCSRVLR